MVGRIVFATLVLVVGWEWWQEWNRREWIGILVAGYEPKTDAEFQAVLKGKRPVRCYLFAGKELPKPDVTTVPPTYPEVEAEVDVVLQKVNVDKAYGIVAKVYNGSAHVGDKVVLTYKIVASKE